MGAIPTVWLIAFVARSETTTQALGVYIGSLWQLLSTVLKTLKNIFGIGSDTIIHLIIVRIIFIFVIGVLKTELHQAVHLGLFCALVLKTSAIVIGSLEHASTHQGIFFVLLISFLPLIVVIL